MHAPVAVRARNALLRIDGAARALQANRRTDDGTRNQANSYDGPAEHDVAHPASSPIEPFPAIGIAQVLHGLISIIFSDFCNVFGPFPRNGNAIARRIVSCPRITNLIHFLSIPKLNYPAVLSLELII